MTTRAFSWGRYNNKLMIPAAAADFSQRKNDKCNSVEKLPSGSFLSFQLTALKIQFDLFKNCSTLTEAVNQRIRSTLSSLYSLIISNQIEITAVMCFWHTLLPFWVNGHRQLHEHYAVFIQLSRHITDMHLWLCHATRQCFCCIVFWFVQSPLSQRCSQRTPVAPQAIVIIAVTATSSCPPPPSGQQHALLVRGKAGTWPRWPTASSWRCSPCCACRTDSTVATSLTSGSVSPCHRWPQQD